MYYMNLEETREHDDLWLPFKQGYEPFDIDGSEATFDLYLNLRELDNAP